MLEFLLSPPTVAFLPHHLHRRVMPLKDQPATRGRGRHFRGRGGRGYVRLSSNDRRSQVPTPWQSTVSYKPKQRCFICESILHLANACPHRTAAPQANFAAHLPSLQGYGQPSYAPSSASTYAPWIPDTGASHHITPDLAAFQNADLYGGSERLQMANGQQLNINHTVNASPSNFRNE